MPELAVEVRRRRESPTWHERGLEPSVAALDQTLGLRVPRAQQHQPGSQSAHERRHALSTALPAADAGLVVPDQSPWNPPQAAGSAPTTPPTEEDDEPEAAAPADIGITGTSAQLSNGTRASLVNRRWSSFRSNRRRAGALRPSPSAWRGPRPPPCRGGRPTGRRAWPGASGPDRRRSGCRRGRARRPPGVSWCAEHRRPPRTSAACGFTAASPLLMVRLSAALGRRLVRKKSARRPETLITNGHQPTPSVQVRGAIEVVWAGQKFACIAFTPRLSSVRTRPGPPSSSERAPTHPPAPTLPT